MRRRCQFFFLAIVVGFSASEGATSDQNGIHENTSVGASSPSQEVLNKLKKVKVQRFLQEQDNEDPVKIPLHRQIADVLNELDADDKSFAAYRRNDLYSTTHHTSNRHRRNAVNTNNSPTTSESSDARAPRNLRFEIEANDEATGEIANLNVQLVELMAVTRETTFHFSMDWDFDERKVRDFVILASGPELGHDNHDFHGGHVHTEFSSAAEVGISDDEGHSKNSHGHDYHNHGRDGMTILSIDKSTGNVRGFQTSRTSETGQTRRMLSNGSENDNGQLQLLKSTEDYVPTQGWECDAIHPHDFGDEDEKVDENVDGVDDLFGGNGVHRSSFRHGNSEDTGEENLEPDVAQSSDVRPHRSTSQTDSAWIEPKQYAFHVDLYVEIDQYFIKKQGSPEAAVEYINFLVTAANIVFEHEVDAHLNIVRIEETDRYDEIATVREALKSQRLKYEIRNNDPNKPKRILLYHAMLGRYLGGGVAFIDTICDSEWGFGVTSDLSGTLRNVDNKMLFDFFVVTHELGHSLGSGHTYDAYDPPVDICGAVCTVPGVDWNVDGLPLENAATLMSYCNFCDGGLSNVALTLGGKWNGKEPKSDVSNWVNSADVVGDISVEPRRVAHAVWEKLSGKGKCVEPPAKFSQIQGCNDVEDCNDSNVCTVDVCESSVCVVSQTLENCCGNSVCETGEGNFNCLSDCGPFSIQPTNFCLNCYALNGFMIDVGLSESAEKRIFVSSISFRHSTPDGVNVTMDLYTTTGSYIGKEQSVSEWDMIQTVNISSADPEFVEVKLDQPLPVGVGHKRGLYLAASKDVILFGEGIYFVEDDKGVSLFSSRAVTSELFGDGIEGFSLSCKIDYLLDDAENFPTISPIETPTRSPSTYEIGTPHQLPEKSTDYTLWPFLPSENSLSRPKPSHFETKLATPPASSIDADQINAFEQMQPSFSTDKSQCHERKIKSTAMSVLGVLLTVYFTLCSAS